MRDPALTKLCGELSRLLHDRSSTPRGEALGIAHRKVRAFAEVRHYPEAWVDGVLLIFLSSRHDILEAA